MTNRLPTLYELSGQYLQAQEALSDLDLPEQVVADTLEGLAGEIELKGMNIAKFIGNLESQADAIKQAEARMTARRKLLEARADWLREYLRSNMERCGITEISCEYFEVKLRKNPPKVVIDALPGIPETFMRTPPPPPPEPDKKAIAEYLKTGVVVTWAHLEQGSRVDIK